MPIHCQRYKQLNLGHLDFGLIFPWPNSRRRGQICLREWEAVVVEESATSCQWVTVEMWKVIKD